jgi:hypothetical protein
MLQALNFKHLLLEELRTDSFWVFFERNISSHARAIRDPRPLHDIFKYAQTLHNCNPLDCESSKKVKESDIALWVRMCAPQFVMSLFFKTI